ncbi:MAG: SRPBCC family protein [Candidatus Omnitrophota bacterium]
MWRSKLELNHHSIFISAPIDAVGAQIVLWGEASWWPKRCSMKFIPEDGGEIKVGKKFKQKVLFPSAPSWTVCVTRLILNREIERTFLDGIFSGKETVTTKNVAQGTQVDYVMDFKINGSFNQVLWRIIFRRLHDRNIKLILRSLKDFMEKKSLK